MLVALFTISTVLLGVFKFIYPQDFPAYVIVIPLILLALFEGLVRLIYMIHFLTNAPQPPRIFQRQSRVDLSKVKIQRNTKGADVYDITEILKKRNSQDDDSIA